MASSASDKLLGVRDGFLRYFHDGLERPVAVAVVPQGTDEAPHGLALCDEDAVEIARRRALALRGRLGSSYHFFVASEGGIHCLELDGEIRHFVRAWAVVTGIAGEAWGSSGSVEIPRRLLRGLEGHELPSAVPGTRRRGGMISSLTGGLENRRGAVATATLHALSTLFYGILESRPFRLRS